MQLSEFDLLGRTVLDWSKHRFAKDRGSCARLTLTATPKR